MRRHDLPRAASYAVRATVTSMPMSADTRSILSWDRLREFLGALRFRKRLVSGIAILIAGASLLASAERQTVYESRAKVLVGSPLLDSDESTGAATNALVTEAELAQSSPVVNLVRNRVGHSGSGGASAGVR